MVFSQLIRVTVCRDARVVMYRDEIALHGIIGIIMQKDDNNIVSSEYIHSRNSVVCERRSFLDLLHTPQHHTPIQCGAVPCLPFTI